MEETEAQRAEASCLKERNKEAVEDDLKTDSFCDHRANLEFNQLTEVSGCQEESENRGT